MTINVSVNPSMNSDSEKLTDCGFSTLICALRTSSIRSSTCSWLRSVTP